MTAVPLKHRTAFRTPAAGPATAPAKQFAALPWRRQADGSVKVLLITSRETRRWVIPKGWPMTGRTPQAAAAQEAYEEAGVVGAPDARAIGAYHYDKRLRDGALQPVEVTVFPMQVFVEQLAFPERGQRQKLWTSPAEAADKVDEPELKALIRRFRPPKA
ncbi:MAG TPA: NUDIX hydrolase [Caulobacteraceae bacterium]